jgi:hypothetical protein
MSNIFPYGIGYPPPPPPRKPRELSKWEKIAAKGETNEGLKDLLNQAEEYYRLIEGKNNV